MDARGAMITELALYRLMFQPPPVGGPGGLARGWLDSAYAQAASNGPVRRNCARNGPTFGLLARCATAAARTARPCRYLQSPPPILAQMWPSILRITRQGRKRNTGNVFHFGNPTVGSAGTE
jgi:hypothetical protein